MANGYGSAAGRGDGSQPAYLIFDTESVPDGKLIRLVKYPDQDLTSEEAIARYQAELHDKSKNHSPIVPVNFQYPVAVCVLSVGADLKPQKLACLDAKQFRPREIVRLFWSGLALYTRTRLVTYNGRGWDLPLMEMSAFRYGFAIKDYLPRSRERYRSSYIDLMDWFSNFNACRSDGGLNLLAKILGKPGKMQVTGDKVFSMHQASQIQEINDYCMFDTLDTYFVFLRTRVLTGEITLEQEADLVRHANAWLTEKATTSPALAQYLDNWGDWDPWP